MTKVAKHWTTEKGWNEVVLELGVQRLHCMVCGQTILDQHAGFIEKPCKHLLFFHDWIGEFAHVRRDFVKAVARIESLSESEGDDGEDTFRAWKDAVLRELPQTAVVFELVRPQNGPDAGDTIVLALAARGESLNRLLAARREYC